MKNNSSVIFILITAFCFGTMEIALKIGGNQFTALQLTFLRFLIGGLILLPFAIKDMKRRELMLTKGDILYLCMLGLIGICIGMTFLQLGVMYCNANTAAVIISSNPVFVMIFAVFIVNERFTKRKVLVLVLSVIGLIFVANPMNMAEGNTVKGLIYEAIACVTFALYTTLGKLRIGRLGGHVQNSGTFIAAALMELVVLIARGEPIVQGITVQTLPLVLYTGAIVTGLGYFCYLKAIDLAGPSNASIAFFIKPVIATTLAALILKEAVTWNIVIGVALIICGSVINLVGTSRDIKKVSTKC